MYVIAIVNEKGGTGKTTTAVNLSAALGEAGRKVLLVDLDGQAASSRWLGVEEDTSFAEALWRGEGLVPIREVVPGVSLAPGSGKLDSVAHDLRPTQGGQLRKLLSEVGGFDLAVIDCPPSLGNRLIGNALLASTHAIVPVETSILALDGLKILLTTFQDVRDGFGHQIALAGVLACRFDARTRLSAMILEELKRALPGKVFRTVIRENVRVRECPAARQSILTYAPDSHAAEDYRALAGELLALLDGAALPANDGPPTPEPAGEGVSQMRWQVEAMLARFKRPSQAGLTGAASAASAPDAASAPASPSPSPPAPTAEAAPQTPPPGDSLCPQSQPQPDDGSLKRRIEMLLGKTPVQPDAEPSPPRAEAAAPVPATAEAGAQTEAGPDLPHETGQSPPERPSAAGAEPATPDAGACPEQPAAGEQAQVEPAQQPQPAQPEPTLILDDLLGQSQPAPAGAEAQPAPDTPPQPPDNAAQTQEDYLALRDQLRQLAGGDDSQQDSPDRAKPSKDSPWRRLFRKAAS